MIMAYAFGKPVQPLAGAFQEQRREVLEVRWCRLTPTIAVAQSAGGDWSCRPVERSDSSNVTTTDACEQAYRATHLAKTRVTWSQQSRGLTGFPTPLPLRPRNKAFPDRNARSYRCQRAS